MCGLEGVRAHRRARLGDPCGARDDTACGVEVPGLFPYMVVSAAGSAVSRGGRGKREPGGIRDCPAAVSGNDRRQQALGRQAWEATASRRRRATRPRVRRPASAPYADGCGGRRPRGTADAISWPAHGSAAAPVGVLPRARGLRRPVARRDHDGDAGDAGPDAGSIAPARDAGAQAQRRHRAGGRQQDRQGGGALGDRPGRGRPAAGGDEDDQRPVRRCDHRRTGQAVDPDGRRADRRRSRSTPGWRRGCWPRTSTRRYAARRWRASASPSGTATAWA